MKSIFVTGGAGFIGSHTCLCFWKKDSLYLFWIHLLLLQKIIRKGLFNFKKKGIETKEKIFLVKGDIKNLYDIERVFIMSFELEKKLNLLSILQV